MPSDLPSICEERVRLLRKFSDAVGDYARLVEEMAQLAIGGQEARANQKRRQCRIAWDEAEKDRLALYRHEADHNCAIALDFRNVRDT